MKREREQKYNKTVIFLAHRLQETLMPDVFGYVTKDLSKGEKTLFTVIKVGNDCLEMKLTATDNFFLIMSRKPLEG